MVSPAALWKALCLCVLISAFTGCHTPVKEDKKSAKKQSEVPHKWYVHCETCAWCKGPFKKSQEAEKAASQHNIKEHNYMRLAYYDTIKCSK